MRDPVHAGFSARHYAGVEALRETFEYSSALIVPRLDGSHREGRILGRHLPAVLPALLPEHLRIVPDPQDVGLLATFLTELAEPCVELEVDCRGRTERSLTSPEVVQIGLEVPVETPVGKPVAFKPLAQEDY